MAAGAAGAGGGVGGAERTADNADRSLSSATWDRPGGNDGLDYVADVSGLSLLLAAGSAGAEANDALSSFAAQPKALTAGVVTPLRTASDRQSGQSSLLDPAQSGLETDLLALDVDWITRLTVL